MESSSDFADFRMFEKVKKIKKKREFIFGKTWSGLRIATSREILRFWRRLNVSGKQIHEYIKIYISSFAD